MFKYLNIKAISYKIWSSFLFCIIFNSTIAQRNIYVDANLGNDANTGLSLTQAFKTVGKSISILQAGDIVSIREGIYSSANFGTSNLGFNINISGSATNFITIQNYNNEKVVINGNGQTQSLLNIGSQQYIKIKGIHFKNAIGNGSYGINIDGNSSHILIEKCIISDINTGQLVGSFSNCENVNALPLKICGSNSNSAINDIIIRENIIENCQTGCSEGLSISGNVNGFEFINNVVRNISNIGIVAAGQYPIGTFCPGITQNGIIKGNTVYNCKFPEPQVNSTAAGIYVDGANNIMIEQNRVYNCQIGIQIGCENLGKTALNDTVKNNVIYDNDKWGLGVGGSVGFVENAAAFNNTTFKNNKLFDLFYGDYGEILIQKVKNSRIQNNLCYVKYQGGNAVFMKFDYPNDVFNLLINNNLYYNDSSPNALLFIRSGLPPLSFNAYKNLGYDAISYTINPELIDTSIIHPELHLKNISPAINAGNNSGININNDFDNNPRVASNLDIGAYEFSICPPFYRLFGNNSNGLNNYKTSIYIKSSAEIKINTSTNYSTNNFIELLPGFKSNTGSIFKAQITGCN